MIVSDNCTKCGKKLNLLHIMVGQLGNFCSTECLDKYKTYKQKNQERKAYQVLARLLIAMNRAMLITPPPEKDVAFIKDVEAKVMNQKDWLKKLSEIE